MLLDQEQLKEQLSDNCDETTRVAYRLLAHAKLPCGMTVRPHSHGYISRELRLEFGGKWYFAAVLNQSWVLWYFRRPALSDLIIEPEKLLMSFPTAEITGQREVKLRISEITDMYAVLGWLSQHC